MKKILKKIVIATMIISALISLYLYSVYKNEYYDSFYNVCRKDNDFPDDLYNKKYNRIRVISPYDGEIKEISLNYLCTDEGMHSIRKEGWMTATENNLLKAKQAPNICTGFVILIPSSIIDASYDKQEKTNCYFLERNLDLYLSSNPNYWVLVNEKNKDKVETVSLVRFISFSNDDDFKNTYDILQDPLQPPPPPPKVDWLLSPEILKDFECIKRTGKSCK